MIAVVVDEMSPADVWNLIIGGACVVGIFGYSIIEWWRGRNEHSVDGPVVVYFGQNYDVTGLAWFDDDWLRIWYRDGDRNDAVWIECHETGCNSASCGYRLGPCPFHPPGCECSEGACQVDYTEGEDYLQWGE